MYRFKDKRMSFFVLFFFGGEGGESDERIGESLPCLSAGVNRDIMPRIIGIVMIPNELAAAAENKVDKHTLYC